MVTSSGVFFESGGCFSYVVFEREKSTLHLQPGEDEDELGGRHALLGRSEHELLRLLARVREEEDDDWKV